MTGRLGEYSIVRELGRGGMGVVYEAQERLSGRPVALKVMHDRVAGTDRGRELFLSEMSILGTLDHPNVVRLLSGFEHQGQLVMVLELIRGQTIREVVRQRGRLVWQDAVFIGRQMLQGLVAAHERAPPVVHRDLKPVNVMVTYEGIAKVMDFGIAKVVQGETHATTDVGTLRYMSPEQIDGGLIDGRSDLYAVGLLLYEMLSGAAPFQSQSTRELLTLQCTAPVPPLAAELGTPDDLVAIIGTLLAKASSERPASARVALAMLESLGPVASLSFSLGHAGPAAVPASPGSNFPGASGWSTASSWGGAASSGWQPTGATNGPASAQPATGGVPAPGAVMPGVSQWNPSMPGAQAFQAPTQQGQVAPSGAAHVAVQPVATKGRGWQVFAGVAAVGLVGLLGWVFFAASSDQDGIAANLPSLPSLPAFNGAEPESGPTGKFADQAASVCRGRPSLSSSSMINLVLGVAEVDGDGVEDVIVRLARPTSGDTMQSVVAISGQSMEVLWAADEEGTSGLLNAAVAEGGIVQTSGRTVSGLSVKTGAELWSKKVSDSVASAVVVDGRVLVTASDGKDFAFDVATGASAGGQGPSEGLLPAQFGMGFRADAAFHAARTPSVDGFEFVGPVSRVSSCQGTLAQSCWAPSSTSVFEKSIGTQWAMVVRGDGTRLNWSREFEDFVVGSNLFVVGRGDHVAVVKDTKRAVDIRMLDAETGATAWNFAWEGGFHFGGAAFGNDRLFLSADCLLALDPKSGEILNAY